jgi:hypothetical protein
MVFLSAEYYSADAGWYCPELYSTGAGLYSAGAGLFSSGAGRYSMGTECILRALNVILGMLNGNPHVHRYHCN